jgi:hypothetical protein
MNSVKRLTILLNIRRFNVVEKPKLVILYN